MQELTPLTTCWWQRSNPNSCQSDPGCYLCPWTPSFFHPCPRHIDWKWNQRHSIAWCAFDFQICHLLCCRSQVILCLVIVLGQEYIYRLPACPRWQIGNDSNFWVSVGRLFNPIFINRRNNICELPSVESDSLALREKCSKFSRRIIKFLKWLDEPFPPSH